MKIAFIRYPQSLYSEKRVIRGGTEIANQAIIDYLRQLGETVVEFAPESRERIDLISIPAIGTPLMFQDLLKRINEINNCDVVITSHWFGSILPEITKPLITLFHHDAKLVLRFSKLEIVEDKNILDKWLGKLGKHDLGQRNHQSLHDAIIAVGEEELAKRSAVNVSVSGFLKKELLVDYNLSSDKIQVVYNGYDPSWEGSVKDLKKDYNSEKLSLACITRLPTDEAGIILKGVDRMLEFFSQERTADKILLGSTKGDQYQKFFAEEKTIHFVENADRNAVFTTLAKSNITIHTSRCESFGLSILESMLTKNVPIAFPTGIVDEVIKNGENGFRVESLDEAYAIVARLDKDRRELARIANNAQQTVFDKMTPKLIGRKYREIIQSII
ncbi:MAG TPA: glycosyltransferase family 4 protein [bacterium]|nr:glycosyltransferase family 4 protein [bacterium]